jgi:hypothetical protein
VQQQRKKKTMMERTMGRGKTREELNATRQLGRGGGPLNRQKGTQGQGGHGGRGLKTPPRMARCSARLIDQEMRIQEGLIVQNKERTMNPYSILEMDEEEELEDEEMCYRRSRMPEVSQRKSELVRGVYRAN